MRLRLAEECGRHTPYYASKSAAAYCARPQVCAGKSTICFDFYFRSGSTSASSNREMGIRMAKVEDKLGKKYGGSFLSYLPSS
ncbi:hypothetical protein C4D60_Mb02t21850 [Musa balbisiana]|uniref:Uncharacterized protein n=1 Tax=Musa balbisiana TaxID=52838 RepID=A0A4S8ICH0_MUSBA|nr:hypothetical protein C4D60_Mb02t21850 [Musa balbisiana]